MNHARRFMKRSLVVLTLVSLLLSSTTFLAIASHNFSDVPDSLGVFHSAVEWIKNRQITSGCTSTLYCPDNPVTRVQMALFMQRLGGVLTPTFVRGSTTSGAVDPDLNPILCQTAGYAVTNYPRQAVGRVNVSLLAAGAMSYFIGALYSTNGGTTWSFWPGSPNFHRGTASATGEWAHASHNEGPLDLSVGSTYLFGVQVSREAGTADATNSRCDLLVEILNRNPSTSPLAPAPPARSPDGR